MVLHILILPTLPMGIPSDEGSAQSTNENGGGGSREGEAFLIPILFFISSISPGSDVHGFCGFIFWAWCLAAVLCFWDLCLLSVTYPSLHPSGPAFWVGCHGAEEACCLMTKCARFEEYPYLPGGTFLDAFFCNVIRGVSILQLHSIVMTSFSVWPQHYSSSELKYVLGDKKLLLHVVFK